MIYHFNTGSHTGKSMNYNRLRYEYDQEGGEDEMQSVR